jgi:hypothetical protein
MGMKQQALEVVERMIARAGAEQRASLEQMRRKLQKTEPVVIAKEMEQARDRAAGQRNGAAL